ncbi:hypothetical protein [Parendozoicomonas sp. Alg238-R29]|uniref:hypothetical protein n=1 Tax=Parendozoicomonas sp. Alg238-R29 TaxID=2993446 RepID=UPI00248DAF52|nr:hypothetical protein [Parendozoicomonas sp. Alg238-R29]
MSFKRQQLFHCLSLITILATGFSLPVLALQSLNDDELGDVTGQAVVNLVTDTIGSGANETRYTRVDLGIDVKTQLNADQISLGTRTRDGVEGADLNIDNLALGYITDNGNGEIEPFRIRNPYIEFAYQGDEIVGMRVGFGEAKGYLSGDISQLSGNIAVGINGTLGEIRDALRATGQDVPFLINLAAGISSGANMEAEAELVLENGVPSNVRATRVGIPNGESLATDDPLVAAIGGLLGILTSNDCGAAGLSTCFPLTNYRSLPVGNVDVPDDLTTDNIEGAARGMFLAFGHQDVQWRDLENTANTVSSAAGAFLNVPKFRNEDGELQAPINVNFTQVFSGIQRLASCYNSGGQGTVGC